MSERISLVHRTIDGFHTFTSPQLKGLFATGETLEEAQIEAVALTQKLLELRGTKPEMLSALIFEDETEAAW